MPHSKPIFVTGATGKQGGSVARHLLDVGFHVRALTRDPSKPAARALAEQGAQVVKGDMDDPASITPHLQDAWGVYSVQNFWEVGYDREIKEGKFLATAAHDAGVKHFVYSSVASADRATGLPHFECKWEIEQHIHSLGLPCTILRPVFFMQNWKDYQGGSICSGVLAQPLSPDRVLQQVDVEDIGAIAALAFANPDQWRGRTIELAGDQCTMPQLADLFGRILHHPMRYMQVPWDQFQQMAGEEATKMYRWFQDIGYSVSIDTLRREFPRLSTIEQCLRREWKPSAVTQTA